MPLFDIQKYYEDNRDYYGDKPLEDVAKTVYDAYFASDNPDFEQWKQDYGIADQVAYDKYLREREQPSGIFRRVVGDPLVSAAKSVVGFGEMATGLADLATWGLVGKGIKALGEKAPSLKYDPKAAHEALDYLYSAQQRKAIENVESAQGFAPTLKAYVENPSVIVHQAIENVPQWMGMGGVIRGIASKAPGLVSKVGDTTMKYLGKYAPGLVEKLGDKAAQRVTSALLGGASESLVSMGQQASQIRQESPDQVLDAKGIAAAVGSGLVTGLIGSLGGLVAARFGFNDLDTLFASGMKSEVKKGIAKRLGAAVEGLISEGVLEELPQSMQEQIALNIATGKRWDTGLGQAAAQGLVLGGLMGAGANILTSSGRAPKTPAAIPQETAPSIETPQQPTEPERSPAQSALDIEGEYARAEEQRMREAEAMAGRGGPRSMASWREIAGLAPQIQSVNQPIVPDVTAILPEAAGVTPVAREQQVATTEAPATAVEQPEAEQVPQEIAAEAVAPQIGPRGIVPSRDISDVPVQQPVVNRPFVADVSAALPEVTGLVPASRTTKSVPTQIEDVIEEPAQQAEEDDLAATMGWAEDEDIEGTTSDRFQEPMRQIASEMGRMTRAQAEPQRGGPRYAPERFTASGLIPMYRDAIKQTLETDGAQAAVRTLDDIREHAAAVTSGLLENQRQQPTEPMPVESPQPTAPQQPTFTLSQNDVDEGRILVTVPVDVLDAAWKRSGETGYLPSETTGQTEVAGRRESAKQFIESGQPIEAPSIAVSDDGVLRFDDGRHRFAVLRDMGVDQVQVAVLPSEIPNLEAVLSQQPQQETYDEAKAKQEAEISEPEAVPEAAEPAKSDYAGRAGLAPAGTTEAETAAEIQDTQQVGAPEETDTTTDEDTESYRPFLRKRTKIIVSKGKYDKNYYSDSGFYSNGFYAIKTDQPQNISYDNFALDIPPNKSSYKASDAKIAGEYRTPKSDVVFVHVQSTDGQDLIVDAKYVNAILTKYPDADVFIGNNAVVFAEGNDVVGVVAPFDSDFTKKVLSSKAYRQRSQQAIETEPSGREKVSAKKAVEKAGMAPKHAGKKSQKKRGEKDHGQDHGKIPVTGSAEGGISVEHGRGELPAVEGHPAGVDADVLASERGGGEKLPSPRIPSGAEQVGRLETAGTGERGRSGDREHTVVSTSDVRDVAEDRASVGEANYSIEDKEGIALTKKQRSEINAQVKALIERGGPYSEDEKNILRQYTGEGGLGTGTSESLNQHYTDYDTIKAIYRALDEAGFTFKKALEPAVGSGNFVGMRPNVEWTTVDIDPTNHSVVRALYPDAKHYLTSFENFREKGFDLIVSNVPFFEHRGVEGHKVRPDIKTLHDFYFVHALDLVRNNGLVVFVTSRGTMDKKDSSVRREIVEKADVLGAFRLPGGHFEKNAHTSVITDIIFLQKRPPGAQPSEAQRAINEDFVESAETADGILLNKYYHTRMENMLGNVSVGKDKARFGDLTYTIDLPADLTRIAIAYKPYDVKARPRAEETPTSLPTEQIPTNSKTFQEWAVKNDVYVQYSSLTDVTGEQGPSPNYYRNIIVESDGRVMVYDRTVAFTDIKGTAKIYSPADETNARKITLLQQIADDITAFQTDDDTSAQERAIRNIEKYKKDFGVHPKSDKEFKRLFTSMDEKTYFAELTTLFGDDFSIPDSLSIRTRYSGSGRLNVTKDSPLRLRALASEDNKGTINILKNNLLSEEDAVLLLKQGYSIVKDTDGEFIIQNDILYYSGNVYKKIEEIGELLSKKTTINEKWLSQQDRNSILERQIQELERIKPKPKEIEEIWFKGNERWAIDHLIEAGVAIKNETLPNGKIVTSYPDRVYERYLNNRQLITRDEDEPLLSFIDRVRQAEDYVVEERSRIINRIKSKPDILEKFEYSYNSLFRNYVKPEYDKAQYLIADVLKEIERSPIRLRKNQIQWIIQALYEGKGINAHDVGGGKTFAAIALARAMKYRGLAQKPIFVVPAKTIKKWKREILTLFPDAKVVDLGNLPAETRTRQLFELTHTNADYVLISHEGFAHIKLPLDAETKYIDGLLYEHVDDPSAKGREAAQIDTNIEALKEVLRSTPRDPNLTFDKLGFDMLVADEAHNYKNIAIRGSLARFGLGIPFEIKVSTTQQNYKIVRSSDGKFYIRPKKGKGPSITDQAFFTKDGAELFLLTAQDVENSVALKSARSYDFRFKANYIADMNNGNNVFLLTATPTPNKPMEVYTMLRHLSPTIFEEYGIRSDTDFARQFFELGTSADESSDQAKNVLKKIVNARELRGILNRYVDKISIENMPWITIPAEESQKAFLEQSPGYKIIADDLQERSKNLPRPPKRGDDTVISLYTSGRSASIDPRLYGGRHAGITISERTFDTTNDKIEYIIQNASQQYIANPNSGQLIFLDMAGFEQVERGGLVEDLHTEIKRMLMKETGLSSNQVAIINGKVVTDIKTGKESSGNIVKKKQDIADAYNEGLVKFIIGTTSSMGEGMDLQVKTTDIWHADIPFTPGAIKQRNGRGIRFGNENQQVKVHYLLMRGTFDAMSLDLVMRKRGWNEALWDKEVADVISTEEEMAGGVIPQREQILIELETNPVAKARKILAFQLKRIKDERWKALDSYYREKHKVSRAEGVIEELEKVLQGRRQKLKSLTPDLSIKDEQKRAEAFQTSKAFLERNIAASERQIDDYKNRLAKYRESLATAERFSQNLTEKLQRFHRTFINPETSDFIIPEWFDPNNPTFEEPVGNQDEETQYAIVSPDSEIITAIKSRPFAKDWRVTPLDQDGAYSVRLPNGISFTLRLDDTIEIHGKALAKGYGKASSPTGQVAAGAYEKATRTIRLRRDSSDNIIFDHELEHFMEHVGLLTPKDVGVLKNEIHKRVMMGQWKTLNKNDIGGAEDRAQFIATLLNKPKPTTAWGNIAQKVRDFLDWLKNIFGVRTVGGVVRDIERGKVFSKEVGSPTPSTDEVVQYSLANTFKNRLQEARNFISSGSVKAKEILRETYEDFTNVAEEALHDKELFKHITKPTISKVAKYLTTPLYDKIPQMREAFKAMVQWQQDKAKLFHSLLYNPDENDRVGVALNGILREYSKKYPEKYEKFKQYLLKVDKNPFEEGFRLSVQEVNLPKGGKRIEYVVHYPDRLKKESYSLRTEQAAIQFAHDEEAALYLRENTWANEHDAMMLMIFRNITERMYQLRTLELREYKAQCKELGIAPKIVWRENEQEIKMSLDEAMRRIGDLRFTYFPRLRPQGFFQLTAINEETNDKYLKFFDLGTENKEGSRLKYLMNYPTPMMREKRRLEKLGYKVKITRADTLPENIYLDVAGKRLAMNAVLTKAINRIDSRGKRTLESLEIKHRFVPGEGGSQNLIIVNNYPFLQKQRASIFSKHGGKYEYVKTVTPNGTVGEPRWTFKNADAAKLEAITKDLYELEDQYSPDVDLLFAETVMNSVADVLKARGSQSAGIARSTEYWRGFEEDPVEAITKAAQSLAGGVAKRQLATMLTAIARGTVETFAEFKRRTLEETGVEGTFKEYKKQVEERRIDPAQQKEVWDNYMSLMREVLRNEEQADRIMGTINGIAVLKYLAFRVAAPIANLTTLPTVSVGTVAGRVGIDIGRSIYHIGRAAKISAQWLYGNTEYGKKHFGKNPFIGDSDEAKELRRLFTEMELRGDDTAQYNYEAMAAIQTKLGKAWGKFMDFGMAMFGLSERINRMTTIAGAYFALKEKYQSENKPFDFEELYDKAKEISDKTNSVYTKFNRPYWARGTGLGAHIGRAAYLFQGFALNFIQNLYDIGIRTKEGRKAVAYMLVSPMVIGGLGAGLGYAALVNLLNAFLKPFGADSDDPVEDIYRWFGDTFGEFVERTARFGLLGALGINLKGSMAMFDQAKVPTKILDVLGAPGSMLEDIGEGIAELSRGNTLKGLEKIVPINALANVGMAYRLVTEGATTKHNAPIFYGLEPLKFSTTEAVLKAFFSFNPAEYSMKRERIRSDTVVREKYEEEKDKIRDRLKRFWLKPYEDQDESELQDILAEAVNLNNRIYNKNLQMMVAPLTAQSLRQSIIESHRPKKIDRYRAAGMVAR